MGGRRRTRVAAAAILAIGASTAIAGTASAGVAATGLDATVIVRGPGPDAVLSQLTLEVYSDDEGGFELVDPLNCSTTPQLDDGPFVAAEDSSCELQAGDYAVGIDGVPEGWDVFASCSDGLDERIDSDGALFSIYGFGPAECTIEVSTPVLLVDKIVDGGPASATDFVIEVYDDQGVLIATGSDVDDATCESDYDPAKCGAIALPSGRGYTLGEVPVDDYVVTAVVCTQYINVTRPPGEQFVTEQIELPGAEFDHDDGDTYCVVTNLYVPPATTTTTTTTTTTPTTTTPTTTTPTTTTVPLVTTTSIDAGVVTLPPTGTSSSTNTAIAAAAALFVLLGGAMVAVRRRPG